MHVISRRSLLAKSLAGAAVLPTLAARAQAATHQVDIRGMAFGPADLTIAPGDSVVFVNGDSAPHTATADEGAFDTGRLSPGQSAELAFQGPGTFAYHCEVHPRMTGRITVT